MGPKGDDGTIGDKGMKGNEGNKGIAGDTGIKGMYMHFCHDFVCVYIVVIIDYIVQPCYCFFAT